LNPIAIALSNLFGVAISFSGKVSGHLDCHVHLEVKLPLPDILGVFDGGATSNTTCDTALNRVLEGQGKLKFITK
jgi:hypothetical protein